MNNFKILLLLAILASPKYGEAQSETPIRLFPNDSLLGGQSISAEESNAVWYRWADTVN